jgi:hypothetical protein
LQAFCAQELALSAVEGVGFHGPGRLASMDRNRRELLAEFQERRDEDQIQRSEIVAQSANAGNVVNRGITRSIFRWIHLVFSIPIIGYIYSPFDKIPNYAPATRFVFVPVMILSGLWMWKGHVLRRLFSKRSA